MRRGQQEYEPHLSFYTLMSFIENWLTSLDLESYANKDWEFCALGDAWAYSMHAQDSRPLYLYLNFDVKLIFCEIYFIQQVVLTVWETQILLWQHLLQLLWAELQGPVGWFEGIIHSRRFGTACKTIIESDRHFVHWWANIANLVTLCSKPRTFMLPPLKVVPHSCDGNFVLVVFGPVPSKRPPPTKGGVHQALLASPPLDAASHEPGRRQTRTKLIEGNVYAHARNGCAHAMSASKGPEWTITSIGMCGLWLRRLRCTWADLGVRTAISGVPVAIAMMEGNHYQHARVSQQCIWTVKVTAHTSPC